MVGYLTFGEFATVKETLAASGGEVESSVNRETSKQPMLPKIAALVLVAFPIITLAGQWEICDYTAQIESSAPSGVRATVTEVARNNPDFCEKVGATLKFEPESENYQSMLPRKRWPKVGTAATLRYRQLVGFCKRDGDTQPCTIKHYSILGSR